MVVGPGIKTGMNVRRRRLRNRLGCGYSWPTAPVPITTYGGPVLVADFGTATTFTLRERQGRGSIPASSPPASVPGPSRSVGSIRPSCRKWKLRDRRYDSGHQHARHCYAGRFVLHVLGRCGAHDSSVPQRARRRADFKVISHRWPRSQCFENDTELIDVYDPDLIFKGMAHIYSRNVK